MPDKNKYLAEKWESWTVVINKDKIPPELVNGVMEVCRKAFYSGSIATLDAVLMVVDLPHEGVLESVALEIREFTEEVKRIAVLEELEGKDARTDVQ